MKTIEEKDAMLDSYIQFLRKRITDLRLEKGVSEHAMSLALGRNGSYIRQITKSDGAVPSVESLIEICDYFEISLSEFFDTENQAPTEINAISKELSKYSSESLKGLLKIVQHTDQAALDALLDIVYRVNADQK